MADIWQKLSTLAIGVVLLESSVAFAQFEFRSLRGQPDGGVTHLCTVDTAGAHCTFTNIKSVTTYGSCVSVVVKSKDGAKKTGAATLCTGELGSRETRTISSPIPGRLVDVCGDANGNLDWYRCDFDVTEL